MGQELAVRLISAELHELRTVLEESGRSLGAITREADRRVARNQVDEKFVRKLTETHNLFRATARVVHSRVTALRADLETHRQQQPPEKLKNFDRMLRHLDAIIREVALQE